MNAYLDRPPKPKECGIACPPQQVCDHCQWLDAPSQHEGVQMTLQKEMAQVLNRVCAENASNTPDFILAKYLASCLSAFETATREREAWYGTYLYPGKDAG